MKESLSTKTFGAVEFVFHHTLQLPKSKILSVLIYRLILLLLSQLLLLLLLLLYMYPFYTSLVFIMHEWNEFAILLMMFPYGYVLQTIFFFTELNECDSTPCLNGALCVDRENALHCHCLASYTGRRCQIGKHGHIKTNDTQLENNVN